ncbi:MAG: formyltransferase family protein [Telmatospirillum sp.]|nr:formyltransferase family protein [Telmatospirillum sp.]
MQVNSQKASDSPISTIILLTSKVVEGSLVPILRRHSDKISIKLAESLDDLRSIPPDRLAGARLLSFGSKCIVPPDILHSLGFLAYNFHPGPPTYPGWAPCHFAVYDGASRYGTTVHEMIEQVDAGPIIGLDKFPVPADASVQDLTFLALASMDRLFTSLAGTLVTSNQPLARLTISWASRRTTRKTFAACCAIPPDIESHELRRRLKAFGGGDGHCVPTLTRNGLRYVPAPENSDSADPTDIEIHGIRFVLAPSQTARRG